ncbi:hypothetical protein VTJ04DRAFT_6246 [Mycothermus thermophilus]|uniref:uncharacterized protein n=1 Tax=Humicola insolens TaxID=85995 RepID=UPI0037429FA0
MAFLALHGALIDDLVEAVTGIPQTQRQQRFAFRDFVARSLQSHTFTRTNQFEVRDRLRGFEERFSVAGRDALADALTQRLDALEHHQTPTTPEVLHLLLELADQPVQKAKLSDLDALVQAEEEAPPPLTWRDIAREDGWKNERDIWRFIDYTPGSSDEDEVDLRSEASRESSTSASSAADDYHRTAQDVAVKQQGEELLRQVQDAQAWRHKPGAEADGKRQKVFITTTQLLREALFMLAGLPTSLFDSTGKPIPTYQLNGVSWETHWALVMSFAECGNRLAPLRAVAGVMEQTPLLQVFQDCVQRALYQFDLELSRVQARLVDVQQDDVVTPMSVLQELEPKLTPLTALADVARRVRLERNPHSFRYLEVLFKVVGLAQFQGSREMYQLLGTIFLDCFRVYLKPIRLWMEEGKIVPGDRSFFIAESPTKLPLHQVWKSQFNLLRTPEGALHAPKFLKPAIDRIFTAGKSIVVLKLMGQHEAIKKHQTTTEPSMDFATVCGHDDFELAPFSELFNTAFQAWIQSKHHTAAVTLGELLFRSYGLAQDLEALQRIYLMSDGSQSEAFASSIFRHLDAFSSGWKDRFTLTEMAQEAFSSAVGGVDTYRLSASIDAHSIVATKNPSAARASVRVALPAIRLHYHLPWPVQIVITDESLQRYQELFTFQLQARRALHVLRHPILPLLRHEGHVGSSGRGKSPDLAPYYLLRTKLLWFCNTLLTYLTTLVLAPAVDRLRAELRRDGNADVDVVVAAHASFVGRVTAEALLGEELKGVREAVLDVFDLAIKLEDAQRVETGRREKEAREVERLVMVSSPYKKVGLNQGAKRRRVDVEEEGDADGGEIGMDDGGKEYKAVLRELHGEFERLLVVVASGLRSAARGRAEKAAKWELLAEMLEVGIKV